MYHLCSTAQHSPAHHNIARHRTAQLNAAQPSPAQHSTAQHSRLTCLMTGCMATPVAHTHAPKGIWLSAPDASDTVTECRWTAFTFVFRIRSMWFLHTSPRVRMDNQTQPLSCPELLLSTKLRSADSHTQGSWEIYMHAAACCKVTGARFIKLSLRHSNRD